MEKLDDGYGTRTDLITENEKLSAEIVELKRRIEKLRGELANSVHQTTVAKGERNDEVCALRQQVCEYGEKAEKLEELLSERNRQYQEDCITINRLHVTIETLSERLAAHMRA